MFTSESPSAPACGDGARGLGDVPGRGRELRVERLRRRAARRRDELGRGLGRLLDVRAREVQLDRRDVVALVETSADAARSRRPRSRRRRPRSGRRARASRGRLSRTKASIPGFCRPIEFSIPLSVSAMRGGGLPSRGSGVTVFVTKASRLRATSGAVERVEAAARVEDREGHAASCRTGPSTQRRT